MTPVRARLRRPLMRAACAASLAGGAALALAACGVPTDAGPHRLAAADLPLALAATTSTTQAGARTPGPVALIQVYFVAGDRLVARSRLVSSPRDVTHSLGSLLAGPTAAEAASGIRTAISGGTTILGVRAVRNTAVIDLSPNFANTGGPDQILALAQVVYTATALPGVQAVSFELDDQPVAVPAANGTLLTTPVTRADYASLLAAGQS